MVRAVSVPLVETGGLGGGKPVTASLPATASHSQLSQLNLPWKSRADVRGNTSSRTSFAGVFFLFPVHIL